MNILVTGGNGFIGSHLTGALARQGSQITVLSRSDRFKVTECLPPNFEQQVRIKVGDVNDFELLKGVVRDADVIFHKVASVGVVAASGQANRHYAHTNICGTANLCDVLKLGEHNVKRILLDSSLAVYGEGLYECGKCGKVRPELRYTCDSANNAWDPVCPNCGNTITPISFSEDIERKGETVYGITKKGQEDFLSSTCKRLGISLTVFRYSSVYGPGQSEANFCAELMRQLASGRRPNLTEDGQQTRDYVSVHDVVRANLLALDSNLEGVNFFNVVSGRTMPLAEFVTKVSIAVSEVVGSKPLTPEISGRFNPGDVRHCNASGERIQSALGFVATTSLEDGIREIAQLLAPAHT